MVLTKQENIEALEALKKIKEICENTEGDCKTCPFDGEGTKCGILSNGVPSMWKFNAPFEPKIYNAFKD